MLICCHASTLTELRGCTDGAQHAYIAANCIRLFQLRASYMRCFSQTFTHLEAQHAVWSANWNELTIYRPTGLGDVTAVTH